MTQLSNKIDWSSVGKERRQKRLQQTLQEHQKMVTNQDMTVTLEPMQVRTFLLQLA